MLKATTAIVTATLILTATVVSAQQRVNVRGTIKQISGDAIVITKKSGGEATVHLNVKSRISGTAKFTLADVKPGMKLGVTTVVRGSDIVAIDVRPIPKRAPDGLSPYDLAPNSTMTNGILEGDVAGTSGSNFITINYGKGKVKVLVPQGTPMSKAVDGSKADLKAGAAIYAATIKTNDGKLNAVRVQVGKNGLSPTQ
jgi:hypothetical protein